MDLIYCASGNKRFAKIARDAGFLLGAQLPGTVYFPIHFADQNWKNPDKDGYMAALSAHRPHIASVLDWERPEQLPEVFQWAEEAAQFVRVVMIIPKVQGGMSLLPRFIGGKPVRLGYSVPTKHGGTELPLWEFTGWPVHLLGGSPGKQMLLAQYMHVVSADGNMALGMATGDLSRGSVRVWTAGKKPFTNRWLTLEETIGYRLETDAPYQAFRLSCENIMAAWRGESIPHAPKPAGSLPAAQEAAMLQRGLFQ